MSISVLNADAVFSVRSKRVLAVVHVHLVTKVIDQDGCHTKGSDTQRERPDAAEVAYGAWSLSRITSKVETRFCQHQHAARTQPFRVLLCEAMGMEERPTFAERLGVVPIPVSLTLR